MDVKLSQEQELLRAEARKLAREAFKERAARWNENREVPRIDVLRHIDAGVRFLSVEPLLDDLGHIDLAGIH